jgi:hypothetical protein
LRSCARSSAGTGGVRRRRNPARLRALCAALWLAAPLAHAGQPLVTDDAAVVAPQTCQLEAWSRLVHDAREYWLQPACNPTGNLEIAVGAAQARTDGGETSSLLALQAKTVLAPRGDGEWSLGLLAGAARDTGAPHGGPAFQAYAAKALASWYPRDDLEIDLNLGVANVYGWGTFVLAGAALQYALVDRLQLLAEAVHVEPGPGKYQVGARWIVVPDRFEAYASYGNRFGGPADQWSVIVGIRLQSPAFLR